MSRNVHSAISRAGDAAAGVLELMYYGQRAKVEYSYETCTVSLNKDPGTSLIAMVDFDMTI